MATVKLGITVVAATNVSGTGNAYYTENPGTGYIVQAPSDGLCTKLNYYVGQEFTGVLKFALYAHNKSQLAYKAYTSQLWAVGWHEITFDTPIAIVKDSIYHPAIEVTSGILSYTSPTGSPVTYRHPGVLENPWTDLTTRTYVSCLNAEYNTAPYGLTYKDQASVYKVGCKALNNFPTVTGDPTSYSILPALPSGLSLNTTTGVITGTPTATATIDTYTVTATNTYGSTTYDLDITVEAAPTVDTILVYADGTGEYTTFLAARNAYSYKDLVTANRKVIFKLKGKVSSGYDLIQAIDGWITGRYNNIEIETESTSMHEGKIDVTKQNFGAGLQCNNISNITVKNVYSKSNADHSCIVFHGDLDNIQVENCFCYNDNADPATTGGIVFDSTGSTITGKRYSIINPICVGGLNGIRVANIQDVEICNPTILNVRQYGIACNISHVNAKNGYAGNCDIECYHESIGDSVLTLTNCYADDATGTEVLSVAGCEFANVTPGSEDLTISETSPLRKAGEVLKFNPVISFVIDALNSIRPTLWSVGAIDYITYVPSGKRFSNIRNTIGNKPNKYKKNVIGTG